MPIIVTFYGVRGSIPAPLKPTEVTNKVKHALERAKTDPTFLDTELDAWIKTNLGFVEQSTFGGNTTCVELRCGKHIIILDMGSGLREQGINLLAEMWKNKGIEVTVLQSHMHHDHIQGFPFWKPLFVPQAIAKNHAKLYGGKDWDMTLQQVLKEQMTAPVFPVEFVELAKSRMAMEFETVHDGKVITIGEGSEQVKILCRNLQHPQVTYGYRVEYQGSVIAFCTDHEPYAGGTVPRPLLELAKKALLITDCQYSHAEYTGEGGKPEKMGWGHSYPEYIAQVASEAQCSLVVTTHHEPETGDQGVVALAETVEKLSGIKTMPAYEGLVLS